MVQRTVEIAVENVLVEGDGDRFALDARRQLFADIVDGLGGRESDVDLSLFLKLNRFSKATQHSF